MGKVKRGGYIFITRKGDHDPRHVHVFKNGEQVGKWDLEHNQVMEGNINRQVQRMIDELQKEGRL